MLEWELGNCVECIRKAKGCQNVRLMKKTTIRKKCFILVNVLFIQIVTEQDKRDAANVAKPRH